MKWGGLHVGACWQGGFAPSVGFCLARRLPRIRGRKGAYWLADRAVLALALEIAAGSEQLTLSVLALAAAIGLFAVSWPADRLRLT
mgnify:CR=1 FL=1